MLVFDECGKQEDRRKILEAEFTKQNTQPSYDTESVGNQ